MAVLALAVISPATAQAQTKSLKLYYIHTGEKATIAYKKNGRYIASGLKKINWHLRDWRRNEPTKMDPALLDLVWEVYRQSGSKDYITVISGYRSPASNNLLRKRGRGVAKNSQHTLGKALDFYLPDVKLSKLRAIGLKLGVGGVGFYPRSGSPFVHIDTGRVRHWPRMSRQELARVFPDGKTMHIPSDGKPLARYEQAVAEFKRKSASGKLIPDAKPTKNELNFFQRLAQNTRDDEEDDAGNDAVAAPRAVATSVAPSAETAPANEFAALPGNVPVPIIAPRAGSLDTGQSIAIAAAPDDNAAQPEPQTAAEEILDPASEGTLALASLNLPVPSRRPELEPAEALTDVVETPDTPLKPETDPQTSLLALRDTSESQNGESMQVAALTPEEIEDLRASFRPTPNPTPSSTAFAAPRPAEEIPSVSAEVEPVERTATVDSDAASQVEQSAPEPERALEPKTETARIETAALPVPVENPTVQESGPASQDDEATAIKPNIETRQTVGLEPGTRSTGEIAVPSPNPNAIVAILAEVDKTIEENTEPLNVPVVVANLPVPLPRPAEIDEPTSSEPVLSEEKVVGTSPDTTQLAVLQERTISLDEFSAPQVNASSIGQWALATDRTIQDLAEVQAPAYGRNIIRQVPETILVQGFDLQPFGPGQNNFRGKAVTAKRFARLELK